MGYRVCAAANGDVLAVLVWSKIRYQCCSQIGYGFSLSHELGMFIRRSYFFHYKAGLKQNIDLSVSS